NPIEYRRFTPDKPFVVVLGADEYHFIVDTRSMQRNSQVAIDATINGISPAARLASPRAEPFTKTRDTAVLARAAGDEMLAGSGVALSSYDIPDWFIPAFRLAVSDATPMDVLEMIAHAAGGVVQSDIDGTLSIRPLFPVPVPEWEGNAQHIFSDTLQN